MCHCVAGEVVLPGIHDMGKKKKKKLIPGTREWWAVTKRDIDRGYEYFWGKRPGKRPGYSAKGFTEIDKTGFVDPQDSRFFKK